MDLTKTVGGISFLGRKYGWASDNVRNYEVSAQISSGKVHRNSKLTDRARQRVYL
jgi:hypothetical protein